ncbi:peroxidase [Halonotius terrestris]|uniref:Peroxidase n=1 Tax=Halonotius terrestris TaxID=2487750 RepID=A0A8J8PCB9_9EURY|nr:heme peroxidase family protein [Halonotius terrestris]TQQ82633.1 peroxidase [Halonotius terrestris]
MSTEYTVCGRVSYPDGIAALGVTVLAVDSDLGTDDPLGAMEVRPDGSFEIHATSDDVGGAIEGDPEIVLYCFREGERIHEQSVTADPETTVELTVSRQDQLSMESMMNAMCNMHHGLSEQRGMTNVSRAPFNPGHGRFGRLFPYLEPADHDEELLEDLGRPGGPLDESTHDQSVGEASVPAGIAFFGQFIDHDITLDPLSSLARRNDPDALRNFRTPGLDLDSVYGTGPETSPFLYESPMQGGSEYRLLVAGDGRPDVPRNREGTALTGDHRNDENHILSQFQYAMLEFHNSIVDWLGEGCSEPFERANQLARWHYQWIVLEEFLPTICDEDIVDDVRQQRAYYTPGQGEEPYIPVEFSVAAYRYGHSQIRERYRVNSETKADLFGHGDDAFGMGFQAPSADEAVDWRYLFDLKDPDIVPQSARAIDPLMSPDLLDLPFIESESWRSSLASRNLVRGKRLGLPSGQAVARAMGIEPLSNEEIGFDQALAELDDHDPPADIEAPLWHYILAEAREASGGDHLGAVGSRIVAETLVGLIESDPSSFLTVQPEWTPTLPAPNSGDDEFAIADLLEFAVDGVN